MDNDILKFIEKNPNLKWLINRAETLSGYEAEIKESQNDTDKLENLEIYMHLSKSYVQKMLEFVIKQSQKSVDDAQELAVKYSEICEKLSKALDDERQQNREMFDNLCMAFTVNPRGAFEMILTFIERDEKSKCQDGFENLSWTTKFGLFPRIRMAWKLIFG